MSIVLPPFPPDTWLPPPSPPPPPPPSDQNGALVVVGHLVIAFAFSLFAVFLCSFLCSCCEGYRNGQARAAANAAAEPPTQLQPQLDPAARNGELQLQPQLDPAAARNGELQLRGGGGTNMAARLPAFKYSRTVKHNVTGCGEEAATCSVCLGAFQLGESMRLLPVCLHLYHAECIDLWLDAHSTCPICRSDTDPTMGV